MTKDKATATAHTEGIWHVETDKGQRNFNGWDVISVNIESPEGDRSIAMVNGPLLFDEPMANARLIAAAPDYHAAAKKMMAALRYARDISPEIWDVFVTADLSEAWDDMKAAIAKASPTLK